MKHSPTDEVRDSIFNFWTDWHARRKASKVPMQALATKVNSNRSTIYDLGKPKTKTNQFQGVEFVAKALAAIELAEIEQEAQLARYRVLESQRTPGEASRSTVLTWKRPWAIATAASFIAAIVAIFITVMVMRPTPLDASPAMRPMVIEVQNKVALGTDALEPDTSLAYLSARREGRCGRPDKNCKVPDTDVDSGTLLVAICQAVGEELVNYNLDSPASDNPHRWKSKLWYKARLHDGREGYISEVYILPRDRGGLGLPTCAP